MEEDRFASPTRRPLLDLIAGAGRKAASPREKHLKDWRIVKRARFNAAKRFERKQSASTLAFAWAGVVGFLVPFYTLLFKDSLSIHTKNVFDFTAYVTGALSLILGLVEQAKNYPALALRFDQCARRVNSVLRRLTACPPELNVDLDPFVREYESAIEECKFNHDDIDYEIAKAQQDVEEATDKVLPRARLAKLKNIERVQIYWLYIAIWVTPALVGIILWWNLHPGSEATLPKEDNPKIYRFLDPAESATGN